MEMIKAFFKSKANMFVIKMLLLYVGWRFFHQLVLYGPLPVIWAWWHFTVGLGSFDARISGYILTLIGQHNTVSGIHIDFVHPERIWDMRVEEQCLAIPAMIIFTGAIAAFPGPVKSKLWFIPLGLFLIFCLNIFRIVLLSIIFVHYPMDTYTFYHKYVYVVITYTLIVLMTIFWIRKYGGRTGANPAV